jgi:hypothetical protein
MPNRRPQAARRSSHALPRCPRRRHYRGRSAGPTSRDGAIRARPRPDRHSARLSHGRTAIGRSRSARAVALFGAREARLELSVKAR